MRLGVIKIEILRVFLFPYFLLEEVDNVTILPLWLLNTDLSCCHLGTPGASAGCSDQCNCHPTIYSAAHPQVGMNTLRCEASGYAFKSILRLHSDDAVDRDDEWVEVTTLKEASLQVLTLFLLLHRHEALLRRLFLLGEDVGIHNAHVVNTVRPSLPEVADQQISLLLGRLFFNRWVLGEGPFRMVLSLLYGATWVDEEVV